MGYIPKGVVCCEFDDFGSVNIKNLCIFAPILKKPAKRQGVHLVEIEC